LRRPQHERGLFPLCANTDPQRDSTIITNPSDSLDHAPSVQNVGSHMGLDATRKLPGEGYHPWLAELVRMDAATRKTVVRLQSKRVDPSATDQPR
jgi:4-hydroxy-3-polyprenylbenzoate decarboxylase